MVRQVSTRFATRAGQASQSNLATSLHRSLMSPETVCDWGVNMNVVFLTKTTTTASTSRRGASRGR